MRATLVCAALALASAPGALAWGAAGHEIVATIAQMHLHPDVLPVLCDILHPGSSKEADSNGYPPCHLAPIAAWADRVRMTPAYRHTASWHYVGAKDDMPGESCVFPGERGWAGRRDSNVLAALGNQTYAVAGFLDGEVGLAEAADALKFLVHFAGDMHMPLHLTGRERGGNGAKVTFDGRMTNLHSVWDSFLLAQALRSIPANYSRPMLGDLEVHLRGAIYDGYVRRLMIDGFGLSLRDKDGVQVRSGEGRFGAVEEWLACPSEDEDDEDEFAEQESSVMQTVLRSVGRVLSLEGRSEVVTRNGGVRRRRHNRHTKRARGLWSWLWAGKDEERWDDDVLCPYAWARAIHELNCEFPIWPAELDKVAAAGAHSSRSVDVEGSSFEHHDCDMDGGDAAMEAAGRPPRPHPELLELDTPEYAGRVREGWVVERLLAMAGIRLAGILNGLVLGEGENDVRIH
ncbi:phospholipase C/P1 nuclease [Rhodofomes roseus]|uniref:Phospholipase C/P1 nuclease n=1 Tax=Rhodofomes roseus TaxID=34475 RepID=A0ABQ8KCJ2_9APHY|nr:phospholipase C/P1 nuclease [Rhodofomes roseus]KAH9835320.1 phospholipase C/P1 nuclease [Rhodofomes roseus]